MSKNANAFHGLQDVKIPLNKSILLSCSMQGTDPQVEGGIHNKVADKSSECRSRDCVEDAVNQERCFSRKEEVHFKLTQTSDEQVLLEVCDHIERVLVIITLYDL